MIPFKNMEQSGFCNDEDNGTVPDSSAVAICCWQAWCLTTLTTMRCSLKNSRNSSPLSYLHKERTFEQKTNNEIVTFGGSGVPGPLFNCFCHFLHPTFHNWKTLKIRLLHSSKSEEFQQPNCLSSELHESFLKTARYVVCILLQTDIFCCL